MCSRLPWIECYHDHDAIYRCASAIEFGWRVEIGVHANTPAAGSHVDQLQVDLDFARNNIMKQLLKRNASYRRPNQAAFIWMQAQLSCR